MNRIIEKLFKRKSVDLDRLLEYGFSQENETYIFQTFICDNKMKLTVKIDKLGNIDTEVFDTEVGEEYTLFLVEDAKGSFVGTVRSEYESVLSDIADNCFQAEIFKSNFSKDIITYVQNTYSGELEFLWEKSPSSAIWRRKDNRKWYGALLSVSKRKLGLDSDEIVEIIDLRISPEELEKIVDNKKYFKGYHMNKKHWITICLDGSIAVDEVCKRIDESYILADK